MRRETGAVTDRPWGTTLAVLGRHGFTGLVTVAAERREYTLAFDLGAIVNATSPLASDSAARLALTNHLISSSQVAELSRRIAAAPDRDDIEIVGEAANLTPEHLDRLRAKAVAQRAARTFSLDQGTFVVDERIAMPPGTSLEVPAVIYQGARFFLSEPQMAAALRTFGTYFILKPQAIAALTSFGFGDEERPILEALRSGTSLPELEAAHRQLDPRIAQAIVYALMTCDCCQAEHRAIAATPSRAGRPTGLPPVQGRTISEDTSYVIARTATPREQPFLGRTPTPGAGGFERTPTSGPPVTARTSTIGGFERTPTSGPPVTSRTATAGGFERTPTSGPPVTARTVTGPPAVGRASTGQPAVARTSTARRTQALIAARTILLDQGADHFAVLGVPFDAPADVVKTAYLELVSQLHPDRLAQLDLAATPSASKLFSRIGVAFTILTDPAKREAYLASLASRSGTATTPPLTRTRTGDEIPTTPAGEAARRGDAALRRDDPQAAVIELARACELDPENVDYQALLAWAQFCAAGDRPAAAPATRKALERAIAKSARPVNARFLLGRVERILGRDREALRHFEEVLAEQPRHPDAAAELRALHARQAANGRK